jgi:mannan endo-1,4-beta-mannosidase
VNFAGYWLYDAAHPARTLTMIDEVEKTGANAVRLVWQGNREFGRTPRVLDALLGRLVADHMIAIPELHRSADGTWMTCSGIQSGAVQKAGDYWTRPAVLKVLKKYEGHILLNIANEVGSFSDNPATLPQDFIHAYTPVIRALRQAGLRSPLMIDAPNCGQAGETLAQAAAALLRADPLRNLVFSVHTYWGRGNYTARLNSLVTAFGKKALVIGEFSQAQDCVFSAPANDYHSVLAVARARHIGYLAWQWGGGQDFAANGAPCPADARGPGYSRLGMTDKSGAFAHLAGWGQIVADDIQRSAVRPHIFPE